MNAKKLPLALGLSALSLSSLLTGCGAPEDDAKDAADEAPIGQKASALASCFGPVRAHANWIAVGPYTNFVSAHVVAPGLNRTMWIDRQSYKVTPGFCLPGGKCFPAVYRYTISGDYAGDVISINSEGYMTINGTSVTPSACSAPSSTSTQIVGTAANGSVYTVTLQNHYLG